MPIKTTMTFALLIAFSVTEKILANPPDDGDNTHTAHQLQPIDTIELVPVLRYLSRQETRYRPKQVIRYRPVIKERMEVRTVKVPVPIEQVMYREETYSVWHPTSVADSPSSTPSPMRSSPAGEQLQHLYQVRKIPVQINHISYREEKRYVKVQRNEMEAYRDVVYLPITDGVVITEQKNVSVPKRILQKITPQYVDPFSPAILAGYSLFATPIRQPDVN